MAAIPSGDPGASAPRPAEEGFKYEGEIAPTLHRKMEGKTAVNSAHL